MDRSNNATKSVNASLWADYGFVRLDALVQVEQALDGFIQQHCVDEQGLLYWALNKKTLKPWTAEELSRFWIYPIHEMFSRKTNSALASSLPIQSCSKSSQSGL